MLNPLQLTSDHVPIEAFSYRQDTYHSHCIAKCKSRIECRYGMVSVSFVNKTNQKCYSMNDNDTSTLQCASGKNLSKRTLRLAAEYKHKVHNGRDIKFQCLDFSCVLLTRVFVLSLRDAGAALR